MASSYLSVDENSFIDPSFRELIPKDVYDLLVIISREGFSLTLVGGAVRDYALIGQLSHDLDFELRHTFEYDEEDWTFRLNRLGKRLRKEYGYQVEFLSFSIIRVFWPDYPFEVELSSPRFEIYPQKAEGNHAFGHSDFDVQLVSAPPYKESFKRRDFTLNAMGIEFGSPRTADEFKFIDPFNGLKDLKEGLLNPCGDDFSKDPVRFCRAIRFSKKFNFSYGKDLEKHFSKFNLEHLSSFYFLREALKVNFFAFTNEFFNLAESYGLPLGKDIKELSFLKEAGAEELRLKNNTEVLMALIFRDAGAEPISKASLEFFCQKAKISEKLIPTFQKFQEALLELEDVSEEDVMERIHEDSPKEFFNWDKLSSLKKYHQIMRKQGREFFSPLGAIHSHIFAICLRIYDFLPGTLEGKEIFERILQEESPEPKTRGDYEYYCHFLKRKKRQEDA